MLPLLKEGMTCFNVSPPPSPSSAPSLPSPQDLLEADAGRAGATDASGNPILQDVGMFLKAELKGHFKEADIKYIDPSYIIR
jgi:hypothetical protein